jgi:DNA-binding YbaB/EbfC family protein
MSIFDQFKNLKNLGSILSQSKELKAKFEAMQEELGRRTVEADAGAGAVRVVMNGRFEVQQVTLDPAMIVVLTGEGPESDRAMIEELIVSAVNAAVAKTQAMIRGEMSQITGGLNLNLPGM